MRSLMSFTRPQCPKIPMLPSHPSDHVVIKHDAALNTDEHLLVQVVAKADADGVAYKVADSADQKPPAGLVDGDPAAVLDAAATHSERATRQKKAAPATPNRPSTTFWTKRGNRTI